MTNYVVRHKGHVIEVSDVTVDLPRSSGSNLGNIPPIEEAPGKIYHIDAGRADTVLTFTSGNVPYVSGWMSINSPYPINLYPLTDVSHRPYPVYRTGTYNGYKEVFFGEHGASTKIYFDHTRLDPLFLGHPKKSFTILMGFTFYPPTYNHALNSNMKSIEFSLFKRTNINSRLRVWGPYYDNTWDSQVAQLDVACNLYKENNTALKYNYSEEWIPLPTAEPMTIIYAIMYDAENPAGVNAGFILNQLTGTKENHALDVFDPSNNNELVWQYYTFRTANTSTINGWYTPNNTITSGTFAGDLFTTFGHTTQNVDSLNPIIGLHELMIFPHYLTDKQLKEYTIAMLQKYNAPAKDRTYYGRLPGE